MRPTIFTLARVLVLAELFCFVFALFVFLGWLTLGTGFEWTVGGFIANAIVQAIR